MRSTLLILLCSISYVSHAQFVVAPGTAIGHADETEITIVSSGTVSNGSADDLRSAALQIYVIKDNRVVQPQDFTGNWVADVLSFDTDRTVSLRGNLVVTAALDLTEGIINVPATSRFLFTGPGENLTVSTPISLSFINGIFYQTGGGKRTFPVSINGTFTPAIFEDMQTDESDTIGIEMVAGPTEIQVSDFEDGSVATLAPEHHWKIHTGKSTFVSDINSQVALALNGLSVDVTESTPLVLQRTEDGISQNLKYLATSAAGFVQSIDPVTTNTLAVGTSDEVIVTIYEVITPFGSGGKNDILTIRYIDAYDFIKVKLLDRYGVLVKEWGNDFPSEVRNFDFTQLSPGNYICIAQYGKEENAMKEQSQMITVLRSK